MASKEQRVAVLTGDIVGSAGMAGGALDRAMAALSDMAGEIAGWAGGPLRFTRNRGDGWQVCLPAPLRDLRAALCLRAALRRTDKGLETRIALARGTATLPGPDLNAASGPAFTEAGRALDVLAPPALMVHAGGGELGAATRLADHLSQRWTVAQARAIAPMLAPDPPTHAEVAARLGISRQAVTQALDAAGFDALAKALDLLEEGAG